jgi:phospholipid/cholesterol/gamma-HCH transport system substrate-binding protein
VKYSGEIKVGLLTVVAGVILYFGFNYLRGIDFFDPTYTYYAVYDRVEGLKVSNQVYVNGLGVGRVANISILQKRGNKLLVTLDLRKDLVITDSTLAILADDGLLGSKKIDLKIRPGRRTLTDEDTLMPQKQGGMLESLMAKASPALGSLDQALINVNALLKEYQGMSAEIKKILANTNATMGNANGLVAENRTELAATLRNVEKLTASLNQASEASLKPILAKANTLADSLNALQLATTVNNLNQTIAQLQTTLADINKGQGTLGKLAKDDSLYVSLNRTVASLDSLFVDLKARPKRYVHFSLFGRKEKK